MAADSDEQPREEPDHEPGQEAEHPVDGRLRVYLGRLVDAQGRMKAADALGVNYKTLARGLDEQGPLTVWLRAALLVKALEDGVTALAGEGQASGEAGELAGEVREATEVLRALTNAVEQLRGEHGERLAALEERLAALDERLAAVEAQPRPGETAEAAPVIGAPRIASGKPSASAGGQPAPPTVVTEEAGPGDEDAYGAAWPLVEEWRAVHERHPPEGTGLAWLRDEERLRELEITLIGEHALALPPERFRWDAVTRRAQLDWRERTLQRVRGERRRRSGGACSRWASGGRSGPCKGLSRSCSDACRAASSDAGRRPRTPFPPRGRSPTLERSFRLFQRFLP